ncbi:MAG: AbrB/MazE/SpoVT family DNA-binding domain-containing protein [Candidatus Vogelbacteria bacterium]|nr:AbrB/MazE/SpoVT family DNA-binding domain-containing protein [Candidatus Vogelbacteria bacterium]
MITKVQKWGNSLGIRLPKSLADKYGITPGSVVVLTQEEHKIAMMPVHKSTFTLKELIAGITKENRHDEVDWGIPFGKEVW